MQTFAFILIVIVSVIASLPIARIVRRLRIAVPLPIIQIGLGAALAWPVTGGVHLELEPEVFLLIFIPPLLFADAWQAPKREFWQMRGSISAMAFGLVFFTITVFGFALNWLMPQVPLSVAFAAAAVLSPTDAVAVSSIIDRERLPPRLLHLLEGESLLNDASGLVMFRFATAAALTGAFSLADASQAFVLAVIIGIGAGFISLFLANKALKILSKLESGSAEAQVLTIVLLPFMAYLLAEHWHASGVLAAVVTGMFLGRQGVFRYLGVQARIHAASIWQIIGFALNGAIFILLGLQLPAIMRAIPPELTTRHWLAEPLVIVLMLTLCLMTLRYLFMLVGGWYGHVTGALFGRHQYQFSTRMKIAVSVAGVRGAVTLAGVLALPLTMNDGTPFPARDLVIFLATGVILCWLAIATLCLPALTSGLANNHREKAALEVRQARITAAQAAVAHLQLQSAPTTDDPGVTTRQAVADALIASYRRRIAALEEGATPREETRIARETEVELRRAAVAAEMEALRKMLRQGEINDHTLQQLMGELTLGEATISAKSKG